MPDNIVDVSPWRKTRIETLPSGAKIEVRNRTMQSMIAAGAIPKPIMTAVAGMMKKDDSRTMEATQDTLATMFEFVVQHFVVSPKIIVKGEANEVKGEVSLIDVPHTDQMKILELFRGMEGGVQEFKAFRPDERSDTARPALQAVRPEAV